MQQGDWIVFSSDIPIPFNQICPGEFYAKMQAEQMAREHRGARFFIAQVMASVQEPLPDLQWSDGRPVDSGADSPHTLGASPQNYQERAKAYADTANQVQAVNRRE